MDHFPAFPDLFEEVDALAALDYQIQDFEEAWLCKEPLDRNQKSLFADPDAAAAAEALLFPEPPAKTIIMDPYLSSSSVAFDHEEEEEVNFAPVDLGVDVTLSSLMEPIVADDESDDFAPIYYNTDSDDDDNNENVQDNEQEMEELKSEQPLKSGSGGKTRRGKKKRKPKSNAWSTQKKVELEGTVRLYEQQPFVDPELERCRKNALSAKLNRDRKREEQEKKDREMQRLRDENQRLRSQEQRMKSRASRAEEELRRLRDLLRGSHAEDLLKLAKMKNSPLDPEE